MRTAQIQKTHDNSYPARLQHHLRALSGENVTVLNFGVPGYNMAQELEVLKRKALTFEPDLVVLQYCVNDEQISSYIQPRYKSVNRAIHKSVLLSRVWQKLLYSKFGTSHLLAYVEEYTPDLLLFAWAGWHAQSARKRSGARSAPAWQHGLGPSQVPRLNRLGKSC